MSRREPPYQATFFLLGFVLLIWLTVSRTAWGAEEPPTVQLSLIIDDLGNRWDMGQRALSLPATITYAILPGTPYSRRIAEMAHAEGREVMLHQPMEAIEHNRLGPDALDSAMTQQAFEQTLRANLEALPYVRGVNNHMGSLLTQQPQAMGWLMKEMRRRGGLYFVDSRTTSATVAQRVARADGLPCVSRDIFLDNDRTNAAIEKQLIRAIRLAQQRGTAVAIGHPYPETMTVLEQVLPKLQQHGIQLVSVSQIIKARNQRRSLLWHASLSPSPTAVKNLKQ